MFNTKGIKEFRGAFNMCAKTLRSKIYDIEIKHYDKAIMVKFTAKWWPKSAPSMISKWPEWLFIEIDKLNDDQYYATNILDMWNGVHLLWIFGIGDLFRRIQTYVLIKPFLRSRKSVRDIYNKELKQH